MNLKRKENVVVQIDKKWVVIDRELWKQEHPTALAYLVGNSRLVAGPFEREEDAIAARDKLPRNTD